MQVSLFVHPLKGFDVPQSPWSGYLVCMSNRIVINCLESCFLIDPHDFVMVVFVNQFLPEILVGDYGKERKDCKRGKKDAEHCENLRVIVSDLLLELPNEKPKNKCGDNRKDNKDDEYRIHII